MLCRCPSMRCRHSQHWSLSTPPHTLLRLQERTTRLTTMLTQVAYIALHCSNPCSIMNHTHDVPQPLRSWRQYGMQPGLQPLGLHGISRVPQQRNHHVALASSSRRHIAHTSTHAWLGGKVAALGTGEDADIIDGAACGVQPAGKVYTKLSCDQEAA